MRLIEFPGQTHIIAKNQPQYLPMPAHVSDQGVVTVCWSLTWRERARLLLTGQLWHQILTFSQPVQPQKLLAARPADIPLTPLESSHAAI